MLSIENRINGMLISVMNIVNMEELDSEIYRYHVDYYRFSKPEYKTSFDLYLHQILLLSFYEL